MNEDTDMCSGSPRLSIATISFMKICPNEDDVLMSSASQIFDTSFGCDADILCDAPPPPSFKSFEDTMEIDDRMHSMSPMRRSPTMSAAIFDFDVDMDRPNFDDRHQAVSLPMRTSSEYPTKLKEENPDLIEEYDIYVKRILEGQRHWVDLGPATFYLQCDRLSSWPYTLMAVAKTSLFSPPLSVPSARSSRTSLPSPTLNLAGPQYVMP
ncbi:hypothetical protein BOTBODRAFT_310732 [Botryobasidium botryosum FD-172 SS1]|uniref:Uncharacterized protein n=1 Tax=Botryobasidium botryosum (strain FD-172 SS1) TaxID=930990 RepID=A0A067MY49_BOTB1|nr:hypothetical protein BOTBODRAFT_310732 [Botryobasidium botryosum FD-172 SS1]